MRKYLTVFKLSWQNVLEYRFNFFMGRVRDLLFLLTVYFLWTSVFKDKETLFGFGRDQIVTYVLGASFISTIIFDYAMDNIANGISRGELSIFLIKPVNFLVYHQVRRIASTMMRFIIACGEITVFLIILRPRFFLQSNLSLIILSICSLILALLLFVAVDSLAGISSFWTLHAYGPRFALKMLLDLTSGRTFPLSILPVFIFRLVSVLPFSYLVFFPINTYLGGFSVQKSFLAISAQIIWVLVLFLILSSMWKRGLKIYEAVGI